MKKLTDWFTTKNDLVGRIACLRNKNIELENQLRRKSLAFDKAIEDNALQHSFLTAQIDQLKAQLADARPSFTLPNGVKITAEYNEDESWKSIDIVARTENGHFENVCCADYDKELGKLRVFAFDGKVDEYVFEVHDFKMNYLLDKHDLDVGHRHFELRDRSECHGASAHDAWDRIGDREHDGAVCG